MTICQFAPVTHDAEATHSIIFTRPCCTRWTESSLVCDEHAIRLGERPEASRKTACKWCGKVNSVQATIIEPITTRKKPG